MVNERTNFEDFCSGLKGLTIHFDGEVGVFQTAGGQKKEAEEFLQSYIVLTAKCPSTESGIRAIRLHIERETLSDNTQLTEKQQAFSKRAHQVVEILSRYLQFTLLATVVEGCLLDEEAVSRLSNNSEQNLWYITDGNVFDREVVPLDFSNPVVSKGANVVVATGEM